ADRRCVAADERFGARPLAAMQRLVEKVRKDWPAATLDLCGRMGSRYLAQDLRLAQDERIEPGGHAHEMLDGVTVAAQIEQAIHFAGREVALLRQQPA